MLVIHPNNQQDYMEIDHLPIFFLSHEGFLLWW